jgi:cell division septation protein DedD
MSPLGTLPAEDEVDTEITLGTGKMLALFFGLVILCAIFFGMGFTMGKNSVRSAPELLPSPSTSARTSAPNSTATPAPASESQPAAQPQSAPATSSTDNSSTNPAQSSPSSTQPQAAPAIPTQPGQAYYVQVAAVSKQEDADALVESLKGRQYPAFIANQAGDKLFRVQVGPFTDIKEAEDMRAKLVSDGYNPILKK